MTLDEIIDAPPTISPRKSAQLAMQVLSMPGWRTYSDINYAGVEQLITRFLRSHAKVPGTFSDETMASEPIEVFYWADEKGGEYKGGVFLNGAVLMVHTADGKYIKSLLIADKTAKEWGYPSENYTVPLQ